MRRVLTVVVLVTIMLFGTVGGAYATQYSPPWAHLNTIPLCYQLTWGEGWLDQSGYNCYSSTSLSSYAWYTNMKNDALFISASHGVPGGIKANDEGWIYGKGGSNSGLAWYLKNMSSTDIADLLLFMPIGCNTAVTDPTTYGNLLDEARAKGADIAIGWDEEVYAEPAALFGMGFCRAVKYTSYSVDYPVGRNSGEDNDCMQYAFDYMWQESSLDPLEKATLYSWVTKGQYGQVLKPARYGSW